jgi:glycerol kinase
MIEWLKDSLKVIEDVKKTAAIAESVKDEQGVFLVPSFSGMGAPFWQMDRKASFVGMTFGTSPAHLVKATLESIAFQIKAVIDAMESDLGKPIQQIAMHGGLSKNTYVQSCLSELIASTIQVQDNPNISAQGAAFLAGLQAGIFSDLFELKQKIKTQTLQKQSKNTTLLQQFEEWKYIIQTNTF